MTTKFDIRLHFENGKDFRRARKIVAASLVEYVTENSTLPIPANTRSDELELYVDRGTIFLKSVDYDNTIRIQLTHIAHNIEWLPEKVD